MRTPEFWYAQAGLLAWLLAPATLLVRAAGWLRQRLARPYRAPIPVICVGNLTVGGAGKTPTVLALAARLSSAGINVHCLSRGYGGSHPGPLRVDPGKHTSADVGDEPLLLARTAPAWVARNRKQGAMAAVAAGASLLLLDDGHQNPQLVKDVSLLLVDTQQGIGNGWTLPSGPLREPLRRALARADAVLLVGGSACASVEQAVRGRAIPVVRAEKAALGGAALAGLRLLAFSGIASPEQFFDMLGTLGAKLIGAEKFSDHHPFTDAELDALLSRAKAAGAELITTEKDLMRLPPRIRQQVRTLAIEMRFTDEAALQRLLAPALARLR